MFDNIAGRTGRRQGADVTYVRLDRPPAGRDRLTMAEIGKPERIVEDEPLAWPDAEPALIPEEPAAPQQAPEPAPT